MATNNSAEYEQLQSLKSLEKARKIERENSSIESSVDPDPVDVSAHSESQTSLTGYECEFVSQPPSRSDCPICLLVFREPHQATCCGKIFCKACIYKLKNTKHPCPTCKTEDFSCYPDKGLQQELYSSRVYCPKKSQSCDWEGELMELDKHLDGDDKDPGNLEGCKYVLVNCSFCSESYQRGELAQHQTRECTKRPYTCPTCQEYTATYDDVVFLHQSVCKCKPTECPNKCGQVVQYRSLNEHLANDCELSEMECDFSHAGCKVRVLRKDLLTHIKDSMAHHMILLARENGRLNKQLLETQKRVETLEIEKRLMASCISHLPPFHIRYPWPKYAQWHSVVCMMKDGSDWYSEPFYSHYAGYKLRLKIWCTPSMMTGSVKSICLKYEFIGSEFRVDSRYTLFISTSILDPDTGCAQVEKKVKVTDLSSETMKIHKLSVSKCFRKGCMEVCVEHIEVMNSMGSSS